MKKVILMTIVFGAMLWAVEPWRQQHDPILWWYQNMLPLDTLNRAFEFNDTLIWVAGDHGTVYKYTGVAPDRKMTLIEIPHVQKCRFTDIFFIDEMHGWVVGKMMDERTSSLVVCRTIDGGNRWIAFHLVLPDTRAISYVKVRFGNKYDGFILCNDGTAFKTNDGGISWVRTWAPDRRQ